MTTTIKQSPNWFDVDRVGLRKMMLGRSAVIPVMELLQNAWDQNTTRVDILVEPVSGRPCARVIVKDDDPRGFTDITHAFTLFADSRKRSDPKQRGRFNMGEKLVLAFCDRAEIRTTTGTVLFDKTGRHLYPRRRTSSGSVFDGEIRMTREQITEVLDVLRTTIPPKDVQTFINDQLLPWREPMAEWRDTLLTEVSDAEGVLRRVQRQTVVRAYKVREGEVGTLYELGIPVVETGDKFHVSVEQKVPLTMDRTNVPQPFLRAVRVGLLNETAYLLNSKEEATTPWVREGMTRAEPHAVGRVMDLRFGERRVSYDPSDPEANRIAVARGYTVVSGGSLGAEEWQNVRTAAAIEPAGKVTPSPKPFSAGGRPLNLVAVMTPPLVAFSALVRYLAMDVIDEPALEVVLADDSEWGFGGCFGNSRIIINVAKFGGADSFFADGALTEPVLALLIHEFAHKRVSGHLTEAFYDECCRIGASIILRGALSAAYLLLRQENLI